MISFEHMGSHLAESGCHDRAGHASDAEKEGKGDLAAQKAGKSRNATLAIVYHAQPHLVEYTSSSQEQQSGPSSAEAAQAQLAHFPRPGSPNSREPRASVTRPSPLLNLCLLHAPALTQSPVETHSWMRRVVSEDHGCQLLCVAPNPIFNPSDSVAPADGPVPPQPLHASTHGNIQQDAVSPAPSSLRAPLIRARHATHPSGQSDLGSFPHSTPLSFQCTSQPHRKSPQTSQAGHPKSRLGRTHGN